MPEKLLKKSPISGISKEETELSKKDEKSYEGERVRGYGQDIDERKKYAQKTFKLTCLWLIGIFILLLLTGFKRSFLPFDLGERVLLAIIGGTTINVLGVFIFVMRYLFDPKNRR